MKKHLAYLTASLLLHSLPASAQTTNWTGLSPADGNWTTAANWNPGVPTTGDAVVFGASPRTATTVNTSFSLASLSYLAAAPSYTTTFISSLTFTGAGVSNLSGTTQNFDVANSLRFSNSSTASDALLTARGSGSGVGQSGLIRFTEGATAASASISNLGSASFGFGGRTNFGGTSTAENAVIMNQTGSANGGRGGITNFLEDSTAGNATLTNAGSLVFGTGGGNTTFSGNATASTAAITNQAAVGSSAVAAGFTTFSGTSTAGSASITSGGGTGGNEGGFTSFTATSSAGNATIVANGVTDAGTSADSNGRTIFQDDATAANATLIANGPGAAGGLGGAIVFRDNATGGTARVIVNAGGAFDLDDANAAVSVGSIEGAGNFLLFTNSLTTGSNGVSTTVSGIISSNGPATTGALVKTGTGTLRLTANNTYRGGTTVSGGTLLVSNPGVLTVDSGTGTGDVSVLAGATLGGTGRIAGSVSTTGAAILAPGESAGQLRIQGNLTLSSDTMFVMELGGRTQGVDYDFLLEGGNVALMLDGLLAVSFIDGFEAGVNGADTFTIIGSNQTIGGAFANVANGDRLATTDGLGSFLVTYGATNGVVLSDFLPVPEPSSVLLIGLSAVALGAGAFRRKLATCGKPARYS